MDITKSWPYMGELMDRKKAGLHGGQHCWGPGELAAGGSPRRFLQGTRMDNVTRVQSWYVEEEFARGLTKEDVALVDVGRKVDDDDSNFVI